MIAGKLAAALSALRPGAEWTLQGNELFGLQWLDAVQSPPTQAEIDAWVAKPRVPQEVTNFQARAALIQAGLFDSVNAAVKGSGDPTMLQAWEYANIYNRKSTFILGMGAALGMTAEQIDNLFIAAAQVT